MMARRIRETLPAVRGTFVEGAPLKDQVWFRVGGPAELLFRPGDIDDLCSFLRERPSDLSCTTIGVGSNLLVRDGGVPGVVIRLPASFARIEAQDDCLHVGAAALDSSVARAAADAGLGGLEFLRGVPGTIGGALRMNAGCYGREIRDVFVEAKAVDSKGRLIVLSAADMSFSYRKSSVPDDVVFVEAVLRGVRDDSSRVRARMDALVEQREKTQPIRAKTGGSTFKNPDGHKAWELIDSAGCRGLVMGGAQVSEKHCNFLINMGSATASDVEALGEEVRRRVFAHRGIALEWEIKRVGVA